MHLPKCRSQTWQSYFLDARELENGLLVSISDKDPELAAAMEQLQDLESRNLKTRITELGERAPDVSGPLVGPRRRLLQSLEELPAPANWHKVLEAFEARGLKVHCEILDFPQDSGRARILVGFLREGLNNVWKHSGQRTAWVQVSRHPHAWEAKLRDRGTGVAGSGQGFGLESLSWQARSLGGKLSIIPDAGLQLFLEVPI